MASRSCDLASTSGVGDGRELSTKGVELATRGSHFGIAGLSWEDARDSLAWDRQWHVCAQRAA